MGPLPGTLVAPNGAGQQGAAEAPEGFVLMQTENYPNLSALAWVLLKG